MNIYVVVEGQAEKHVYKSWIPLVNPSLSHAEHLSTVNEDTFYLITGGGYPQYYSVIDNAINDVNDIGIFNRLVISADSEDMTREEKETEILDHLSGKGCQVDIHIIIQHFCLETWALGNRKIVRKDPRTDRLRLYKKIFNVRSRDPELLPANKDEELNRSQFATKYLRAALCDRYRNLSYSKGAPRLVSYYKYFGQVKDRFQDTQHISSFESFLLAFL